MSSKKILLTIILLSGFLQITSIIYSNNFGNYPEILKTIAKITEDTIKKTQTTIENRSFETFPLTKALASLHGFKELAEKISEQDEYKIKLLHFTLFSSIIPRLLREINRLLRIFYDLLVWKQEAEKTKNLINICRIHLEEITDILREIQGLLGITLTPAEPVPSAPPEEEVLTLEEPVPSAPPEEEVLTLEEITATLEGREEAREQQTNRRRNWWRRLRQLFSPSRSSSSGT